MKKKLALILVLVLCVAVVFTLAACKPKDNGGNGDQKVTVTEQQATAAIEAMEEFAGRWVLNNSTDTYDRSTALRSALAPRATISTGTANVPGTVRVNYNASSKLYTITGTWGSVEKSFTLEAMVADWGDWAGKTYLADGTTEDITNIFVDIYNAFVNTVNDAEAKGSAFLTDGIGFSGKAYFAAGYGGGENIAYALQVKGNIGLTDEDTALAIEVLGGEEVIYGLYFEGAAVKADCKIYLRAGDRFLFLDNANIVTLVTDLFGIEEEAVAAALEVIESIDDIDESGMISMVAYMLFAQGGIAEVDGDITTYQIKLDLEELFANIQSLITAFGEEASESINNIISEFLPPPFNQLDLTSFEGVAGQLLITVVTDDGLITDAEVALNMPKRDFRFSATDDVAKVYGPLNVVIGISGFSVGPQTDIIPVIDDAEYFSPLNYNFSGDVTIKAVDKADDNKVLVDSVFSFELLTDINPFNLGVAKGSFIIEELAAGETEAVNFVTVMYDQATGDGYLIYKDEIFVELNAIDIFNYVVDNYGAGIEEFVTNFIFGMMDEFGEEKLAKVEAEEGGLDIFALLGSVGNIQGWYDALVAGDKVLVDINMEDLLSSVISIDLSVADFNDIVDIINEIGLLPAIEELDDPESVEVYFNTTGYEDIFYVKVVVDGKDYELTIDGSNWEADSVCVITFSVDELVYATITIEYAESATKEVMVVDADMVYTVTITAELIDDPDAEEAEYMTFELEVNITKNEDGVLNGFQVTFTDVDADEYYTVYGEGVAIWTYEKLWGIFDLEFTFDDIPHYGFGFDSNDFCLDVDLDNFYFNWGGANDTIVTVPTEGEFEDLNPMIYGMIDWLMELLKIEATMPS